MPDPPGGDRPLPLSPGAQTLFELVLQGAGDPARPVGARVWALALFERLEALARTLVADVDPHAEREALRARIDAGDPGAPLAPDELYAEAAAHAARFDKAAVYESDLAPAILRAAGYAVPGGAPPPSAPAPALRASAEAPRGAAAAAQGAGAPPAPAAAPPARQPAAGPRPRPTPTLDELGRDLTRLAREGRLTPLVGRADTLDLVVETLCRRTTRNPALIGPPGIGKTAIVEGLAQRIVAGDVPPLLHEARLVELQASALVAGTKYHGSIEERMQKVIAEASQPGIVLFFDELHSIMGAGGMPGTSDVASQLKPALARGDIACIAATTDDEYRRFIEPDRALERRFQPIRIQEPSAAETLAIVARLAVEFERTREVRVPEDVQRWIVDYAGHSLPNRRFPAKAVDLLEQCVAFAVAHGRGDVDAAAAEQVGRRLTGVPGDVGARRAALGERLRREGLLPAEPTAALLDRLEVTLPGLDLRPHRPNAIVLLHGDAVAVAAALAEAVAEALFGAADRIVEIDFGRFAQFDAMTSLLGAPPGYVGHGDPLPIHRIVQMPWCVLRCDNVHACHPQVRGVLAQACESGYFTDARGDRIYLSDAVLVLTADVAAARRPRLGLTTPAPVPGRDDGARAALEELLGHALLAQCDVVVAARGVPAAEQALPAEQRMLAALAERFEHHGLALQWDPSVLPWLRELRRTAADALELERLVDQQLGAPLARYAAETHAAGARAARVRRARDAFVIEPLPAG